MATNNKDFKVKNGLIVEGTTATVFGNNVLTTASSINDLADVNASSAEDGEFLSFDTTTNSWIPVPAPGSPGALNTDQISEGTQNLYFTNQRAIDAVANGSFTTDVVEEGTGNLYFTNQRAVDAVTENISIDNLSDVSIYIQGVIQEPGVTWTTQTSNFETINIRSISYGNNLFVAGAQAGQLRISTNAINWVTVTSNFVSNSVLAVEYDSPDNIWVIGGTGGQLRTSTNAIAWVTQNSNFGNTWINSIKYGNSLLVAGGDFGQLRTSTDTINWVTQNSNFGTTKIRSIAYGNNLWLAGGYTGQIRSSTDAINWVTRTSNFGNTNINTIAYGNGLWVAGGNGAELRTSTDTITWVTRNSSFGFTGIYSVIYANSLWVAAGQEGQIRTSDDTINWVTRVSNFSQTNIFSMAYGNNVLVAAGNGGEIRTSELIIGDIDPSDGYSLIYNTATTSWIPGKATNINDIEEITSSRALKLTDSSDFIKVNSSTQTTITVPKNSTVSLPIKTEIHFIQYGIGQLVFAPVDGSVTIRSTPGLKTRSQWSVATLLKIATDEWVLTGDLVE